MESFIDRLRVVAPETPSAMMRPAGFFLAGSGVLTVAFDGFTPGLRALKTALSEGLRGEDPGSLWPKVTLAALTGKEPLSLSELQCVWRATEQAGSLLAAEPCFVLVDQVWAVEALVKSLELTGATTSFPLASSTESEVEQSHREYVGEVLGQWNANPSAAYLAELGKSGHRREHYQRPCRATSLVSYVPDNIPGLSDLEERLSRVLPGRFHWFESASRHLTIRTLDPVPQTSEFEAVEFFSEDNFES
ncbi:MAG: hypothetical protein ACI80V_002232 [Rhodothermales bacterium]|jgi:hypothetical protein